MYEPNGIYQNSPSTNTILIRHYDGFLCYEPEGRGFDSRWCRRNFLLT